MAQELAGAKPRFAVLTDSPSVADLPGVSHILLGGQLRHTSRCLAGPVATENLKQFTIITASIGVNSASEGGVTVSDLSEDWLKDAVGAKNPTSYLPIDHSKAGVLPFRTGVQLIRNRHGHRRPAQ
jgi:DeoR/GlpR family transcriptional regulator of sugar metabolism